MEDGYYILQDFLNPDWLYCGVYDGHGDGDRPAKYAMDNIHKLFAQGLKVGVPPADCFAHAYNKVSTGISVGGVCAADLLFCGDKIHYANVGDAKIMVIGNTLTVLSAEHNVDVDSEFQRLIKSGAIISDHYIFSDTGTITMGNGLMPSRTLGDADFKLIGVIAEPTTGEYRVKNDDRFIIAATDGLFDAVANFEIEGFASVTNSPKVLAITLCDLAIVRGVTDDITVVAIGI
jgi:serine/threonine protein phosphatase PrpC